MFASVVLFVVWFCLFCWDLVLFVVCCFVSRLLVCVDGICHIMLDLVFTFVES